MSMHAEALGFRLLTRMLQSGVYVFHVSVSKVVTTLVSGKCFCVPTEAQRMGELGAFMTAAQVDCAFLTPTVARLLDQTRVPTLKTLFLGG